MLTSAARIPRDQARAIAIHPEAGFVGLSHGDFHAGNLLRNRAGAVVLIDLDRIRLDGIQVFDRIHCVVVEQEQRDRRHWLTFFSPETRTWANGDAASLLRGVSANSLRAYFLWRQATELRAMPDTNQRYARRLRACVSRILGEAPAAPPWTTPCPERPAT
jgi:hypothetical protein